MPNMQNAVMLGDTELPPLGTIIRKYIEIRDYIEKREKALAAELAAHREAMKMFEGMAMHILRATKQQSGSSEDRFGTVFFKHPTSIKVVDREAFHAFVIAENQLGMLTAHVTKDAVEAWLARPGPDGKPLNQLPPGVTLEEITKVEFRKL